MARAGVQVEWGCKRPVDVRERIAEEAGWNPPLLLPQESENGYVLYSGYEFRVWWQRLDFGEYRGTILAWRPLVAAR